jgi:hypothetical protein
VNYTGNSFPEGGIDFMLGLENKFNNAPVNLSLDLEPILDFVVFPKVISMKDYISD